MKDTTYVFASEPCCHGVWRGVHALTAADAVDLYARSASFPPELRSSQRLAVDNCKTKRHPRWFTGPGERRVANVWLTKERQATLCVSDASAKSASGPGVCMVKVHCVICSTVHQIVACDEHTRV